MNDIFDKAIQNIRARLLACCNSEFFLYFLLAITLVLVIDPQNLNYSFDDMDEIWNYQFARRILHGFIPYRDFMMLPLPLSAQFNGWLLSVFSDKLTTMRWIASSIAALNGLIAFRILMKIGKGYIMAFFYTAFFLCPFFLYPPNNYNWYAVLFLSLALLIEIYKVGAPKTRHKYFELMIGASLGLVTITKQNIGVAGMAGSVIFLIYYCKGLENKYLIQSLAFKIIGWFLVVGAEICYLAQKTGLAVLASILLDSMHTFVGYARTPYLQLFNDRSIVLLFAVFIPAVILLAFYRAYRTADEFKKKTIILVSIYALVNFTLAFPISDWLHLIFGMPIPVLAMSLIFNKTPEEGRERTIILVGLLGILALSVLAGKTAVPRLQEGPEIRHYEFINIPLGLKTAIMDLDNFIYSEEENGQTVYFLNYQATYFLIPMDKFCYKYDDIVGANSIGEREIIERLSQSNRVTVIIRGQNGAKNWQETTKIEEYVRANMNYGGNLHGFDVYRR